MMHVALADPADTAASLQARVAIATSSVLRTAAGISDQQAREPSLLPGWSRGHVLTHIARNADSLRNLLIWARSGVVTPQYRSAEARDLDIEAGHSRPTDELVTDMAESAAGLADEAALLADADWGVEVEGLRGPPHPAWFTLWRRLSEVEIHHVDLDAGYRPSDWPTAFTTQCIERVVGNFCDPDCPPTFLRSSDAAQRGDHDQYRIGPPDVKPAQTVTGPSSLLLAWLIGRSSGSELTADPPGPLPALPPW